MAYNAQLCWYYLQLSILAMAAACHLGHLIKQASWAQAGHMSWGIDGWAGRWTGKLITPACEPGHAANTLAASWSTSCFLAGLQRAELTSLKRKLCQILAFEDFSKLPFQGKRVANWDFSWVDCFSKISVKGAWLRALLGETNYNFQIC